MLEQSDAGASFAGMYVAHGLHGLGDSSAVARGEPLDDELRERAVESVVDEPLELGSVRVDRGGDAPLELDGDGPGHARDFRASAPATRAGNVSAVSADPRRTVPNESPARFRVTMRL
jgi:hypothetical protein